MDLTYSAEQQDLADSVRRFCLEQISPERLAAWARTDGGLDDGLWRQVSDLGWLGIGLPTAAGGSGLGLADVACLLSECSRGLMPLAVSHAIRGADALAVADPAAPELRDLALGSTRVALCVEEESATEPALLQTRVRDGRIDGRKVYVANAGLADLFLVAARQADVLSFHLVESSEARVEALRGFATGDAQGSVNFENAAIRRSIAPPRGGESVLERIRRRQVALALAEMIGGMDAVLERTVAYVKEREQFGQKIAVFQAVQHQIADMATAYTAARHLAWQAITRVADDRDEPIDLPAAAAWVGTSYKQLAVTAHHLHGGAGFVVEHPLHYYSERAQALSIRYTPERDALADVAAVLLD